MVVIIDNRNHPSSLFFFRTDWLFECVILSVVVDIKCLKLAEQFVLIAVLHWSCPPSLYYRATIACHINTICPMMKVEFLCFCLCFHYMEVFFLCLHFIKVVMYVYTIMTRFKHRLHNCIFCVSVWIKLFRSVYWSRLLYVDWLTHSWHRLDWCDSIILR